MSSQPQAFSLPNLFFCLLQAINLSLSLALIYNTQEHNPIVNLPWECWSSMGEEPLLGLFLRQKAQSLQSYQSHERLFCLMLPLQSLQQISSAESKPIRHFQVERKGISCLSELTFQNTPSSQVDLTETSSLKGTRETCLLSQPKTRMRKIQSSNSQCELGRAGLTSTHQLGHSEVSEQQSLSNSQLPAEEPGHFLP